MQYRHVVFTPEELLEYTEHIVAEIKETEPDEEIRANKIVCEIAFLCYMEGSKEVTQNTVIPRQCGKSMDVIRTMFDRVLDESQKRWEMVGKYLNEELNIQLHPLGFIAFIRGYIATSASNKANNELRDATDRFIEKIQERVNEELKPVANSRPVPEIENSNRSSEELIVEYFDLIEKIGTFYQDRDKYDTDEKKQMHDRIVAIYRKIQETWK